MSKTLLTTEDVPKYIRDIVSRLLPARDYAEENIPGCTFNLIGKWKIGYEGQLRSDCQKLIDWCQRHYADAYILSEHFWWTDVPSASGEACSKYHRRKAYEQGFRNYIKIIITDPVAYRFEKDGFYREAEKA